MLNIEVSESEKLIDKDRIINARNFCEDVKILSKKYNLTFFFVTDGASATNNNGCEAVRNARENHIKWEIENKFDPYDDWSDKNKVNINERKNK